MRLCRTCIVHVHGSYEKAIRSVLLFFASGPGTSNTVGATTDFKQVCKGCGCGGNKGIDYVQLTTDGAQNSLDACKQVVLADPRCTTKTFLFVSGTACSCRLHDTCDPYRNFPSYPNWGVYRATKVQIGVPLPPKLHGRGNFTHLCTPHRLHRLQHTITRSCYIIYILQHPTYAKYHHHPPRVST